MIAFSPDLNSVIVLNCVQLPKSNVTETCFEFSDLFRVCKEISVTCEDEPLCKEFCLFVNDGRHLIVCTSCIAASFLYDLFYIRENISNEQTEDIKFHTVDFESGKITDTIIFQSDHIQFAFHSGVSLLGNTFLVTSIKHQTIHMFHITSNGRFQKIKDIGYFTGDDDQLILQMNNSYESELEMISGLKHKMLSFLYKQALNHENKRNELLHFFYEFDQILQLSLWRCQIVDDSLLLIKFGTEKILNQRYSDASTLPALFVFYNYKTNRIENILENHTQEMLEYFIQNHDQLQKSALQDPNAFQSSCNNSIYHRDSFIKHVGHGLKVFTANSIKKALSVLPYSPQSISTSPFFDQDYFRYDENVISPSNRPKTITERAIKVFSRLTRQPLFSLFSDLDWFPTRASRK